MAAMEREQTKATILVHGFEWEDMQDKTREALLEDIMINKLEMEQRDVVDYAVRYKGKLGKVCEVTFRNEYVKSKAMKVYYDWFKQGFWYEEQKFWLTYKESAKQQQQIKVLNTVTTVILNNFDFGDQTRVQKIREVPMKLVINDEDRLCRRKGRVHC